MIFSNFFSKLSSRFFPITYKICGNKVILKEDDCIIPQPQNVADVLNIYFASAADYDRVPDDVDNLLFREAIEQDNIALIKVKFSSITEFSFKCIYKYTVLKHIKQFEGNTALGHAYLESSLQCHGARDSMDMLWHHSLQWTWN